MSSMKELMKKLETDTTFVEDLKQATSPEELAAKLKASIFDIPPEKLPQVLTSAESDELSDNELNTVAGGYFGVADPIYSLTDEEKELLTKRGYKLEYSSRARSSIDELRQNRLRELSGKV